MKLKTVLTLPLLMFALAACVQEDDSAKDVPEPSFGKEDSLSSVTEKGNLTFGEAVESSFNEDLSFHGYQFSSLSEGVISVEVTQLGSSRGLDTTLFVYGSTGWADWERIAFDDDDGWGTLSRIRDLEVGEYGDYMVVVGTADGMGRGDYRLELTCANDACIDDTPVEFDGCDDTAYAAFEACVENELENADWGYDDPAEEWSIAYCVNDSGVHDYRDWTCDSSDAHAPDYCRATREQLDAVAGECETRLKDYYHVIETINLGQLELSEELQTVADALVDSDDDYTWKRLRGYTVPAEEDVEVGQIAASIREDHREGPSLDIAESQTRDEYRAERYLEEDVLDAIEAEYGEDYEVSQMFGSYYVAAGAEEFTDIDVLYFPEQDVAFAITVVTGE